MMKYSKKYWSVHIYIYINDIYNNIHNNQNTLKNNYYQQINFLFTTCENMLIAILCLLIIKIRKLHDTLYGTPEIRHDKHFIITI